MRNSTLSHTIASALFASALALAGTAPAHAQVLGHGSLAGGLGGGLSSPLPSTMGQLGGGINGSVQSMEPGMGMGGLEDTARFRRHVSEHANQLRQHGAQVATASADRVNHAVAASRPAMSPQIGTASNGPGSAAVSSSGKPAQGTASPGLPDAADVGGTDLGPTLAGNPINVAKQGQAAGQTAKQDSRQLIPGSAGTGEGNGGANPLAGIAQPGQTGAAQDSLPPLPAADAANGGDARASEPTPSAAKASSNGKAQRDAHADAHASNAAPRASQSDSAGQVPGQAGAARSSQGADARANGQAHAHAAASGSTQEGLSASAGGDASASASMQH